MTNDLTLLLDQRIDNLLTEAEAAIQNPEISVLPEITVVVEDCLADHFDFNTARNQMAPPAIIDVCATLLRRFGEKALENVLTILVCVAGDAAFEQLGQLMQCIRAEALDLGRIFHTFSPFFVEAGSGFPAIVWTISRLVTAPASAGAVLRFAMDAGDIFHTALHPRSIIQAQLAGRQEVVA